MARIEDFRGVGRTHDAWTDGVDKLGTETKETVLNGYKIALTLIKLAARASGGIEISSEHARGMPERFVQIRGGQEYLGLVISLTRELELEQDRFEIGVFDYVAEKPSKRFGGKDLYRLTVIAKSPGHLDSEMIMKFECTTKHSSETEGIEGKIDALSIVHHFASTNGDQTIVKDYGDIFEGKNHLDLIRMFDGLMLLYLLNSSN